MKYSLIGFNLYLLFALCLPIYGEERPHANDVNISFFERCLVLRNALSALYINEDINGATTHILPQMPLLDEKGSSTLRHYILDASGQISLKVDFSEARATLPELLILSMRQSMKPLNRDERLNIDNAYLALIPLSMGANQSIAFADINPRPEPIPNTIGQGDLQLIADYFFRLGLYEYAAHAHLEYVYFNLKYVNILNAIRDVDDFTVQSNSETWFRIAECHFLTGNEMLGYDYLAKAIIFGGETVKNRATNWLTHQPPPPISLEDNEKEEIWGEIIGLYRKINAHPRAWALVEEFAEHFQNPHTLKEEIQQEWLALVESWKYRSRKIILYGQEVWPHGDPLAATIPWPCSDEAIIKAQKILKEAGLCDNEIESHLLSE